MEPGMYRGDILILRKFDYVENGDMIVYKIPTDPIPIVHRVTSVQEVPNTDKKTKKERPTTLQILTKGDNNNVDDRGLYPKGKGYIDESMVVGHVYATIPYSGYLTLLMNDNPMIKYALIGFMFISMLISKDPS